MMKSCLEIVLCYGFKCKRFFFCYPRLPLYFVVPICISEESILKYEGRGIPVSICAWLRVRNLIAKTISTSISGVTAYYFFRTFLMVHMYTQLSTEEETDVGSSAYSILCSLNSVEQKQIICVPIYLILEV